jgi:adenylate cyclase
VLGISSLAGAVVGLAVTGGTTRGLLQGALSGVLISLFVTAGRAAVAMRRPSRWRFGSYVGVSALVMATAICVGLAAASLPWLLTEGAPSWRTYVIPFVAALVVSIGFTWWFVLDRLLGGGVLAGLITGRYHHPFREERIFLFADLQDSTAQAEALGELRYHAFLNRAFADAGQAVARYGGLIYQYVGDQMVVTWTLSRGLRNWDCLLCAFAISHALASSRDDYEHEFGTTPRFRFAIHCGPVVSGEMGGLRREIVFSGDTLNTVARIEEVAKETNRRLVVSEDLLRQAPLPPELTAESLGKQTLRGKGHPLELFEVAERVT